MAPINLSRDKPPHDEIGIPKAQLNTCPHCGRSYPANNWHRCATNAIGDVPQDVEMSWSE